MLVDLDDAIPDIIPASRALAEAHRLDLALFVAFEEASVRIAEVMIRHAPGPDVLRLLTQQKQDDERHLALFRRRLDLTLEAARPDRARATEAMLLRVLQGGTASADALQHNEIVAAVVIPPLRRYFDACQAFADAGSDLEALVMLDLVLKGMAWSLCEFEARYWEPVDPLLAHLIRDSGEDERLHVALATHLVPALIGDAPARQAQLSRLGMEASAMLRDALHYYIRKLVTLFAVVRQQNPERYAGIEIAPDQPLSGTSEKGQMIRIGMAGMEGVARILRQAGLDSNGHAEPLSHE